MRYRQASVLAQESATTAAVKTIDITLQDVISRLQIKFNSTNNGHTPTEHPAKQITKVEIVDGSDVLLSLSAQQIEALMFYEYKVGRNYEIEYRNDCENRMVLDVLFGRHLWDPTLGLDPKKFKNPQLKITHNLASGGSAPDAATLEVVADVFDELTPSPIGFIMSKEWHTYTSPSTAAYEYIDLPTDHVIKRILLQTYKKDSWWDNIMSEVRVSEDNDKRLPWDVDAYDLMQYAVTKYGPYIETLVGTGPGVAAGQDWYVTPTEVQTAALQVIGDPSNIYVDQETVGGYISLNVAVVSAFRALICGYIPHGAIPLDCGKQNEIDDWYDVTQKGNVKLRLKAGGTATVNTVLQQLRRY